MALELKLEVACLCGATIPCAANLAGRRVRCPECGETHIVPRFAVRESENDEFQETKDVEDYVQNYVGRQIVATSLKNQATPPGWRAVPSAPSVPPTSATSASANPSAVTDSDVSSSTSTRIEPAAVFSQCPNPIARKIVQRSSRRLNKYRVVNIIAEGGMGRVSLARDDEMERTVVVKEIKSKFRNDAAYRRRFIVEAKITGCLDHPGVAPVYSLEIDDDGTPFYAMRKIDGVTFEQAFAEYRVRRSPEQLKELLRHFVSACQTLTYAHCVGVVHRDVKPANIMIGKYGATFVMDWGLAKKFEEPRDADASALSNARNSNDSFGSSFDKFDENGSERPAEEENAEEEGLTRANERLGTPWYRDPDYIRTGVSKPCNDLYAMGVVLYVMLTGETPYKGTKMNEPTAVLMTSPPPPAVKVRSVPRALSAICMKALEKKPENRYPSLERLADDILRWLENEPVSACRRSFFERLFGRRR